MLSDEERISKATERYNAALHAVQSGVATEMALGSKDTLPKHLRVGINSAMINDLAIAELLIAKGIFSKVEYHEAVADAAEKEQALYEARLGVKLY